MPELSDSTKISQFLCYAGPIVIRTVRRILQSAGFEVEEKGKGLEFTFVVKAGDAEVEFYLHNLLLELATSDRDEVPLRFDERLLDPEYFICKARHVIQGRLQILFEVFRHKDPDKIMESIRKFADQYERVRFVQPEPSEEPHLN